MTLSLAAVQTAVAAANTAAKQATITTADYVFTGTVRYADSDHRRLVVFTQLPGKFSGGLAGERLVDANGAAFAIGDSPWVGGGPSVGTGTAHGDVAYDWTDGTAHPVSDHPKPWTRHTQPPEYVNTGTDVAAVFVDVKDIVSMTTATANADTTLGTVLVSTAAGTHRERDAGWSYGTGLEPAVT